MPACRVPQLGWHTLARHLGVFALMKSSETEHNVMQIVALVCGTAFGVLPVVGTYAIFFLSILLIAMQVTYRSLGRQLLADWPGG